MAVDIAVRNLHREVAMVADIVPRGLHQTVGIALRDPPRAAVTAADIALHVPHRVVEAGVPAAEVVEAIRRGAVVTLEAGAPMVAGDTDNSSVSTFSGDVCRVSCPIQK